MAEINQEIKELQKLSKMDLIILLGELGEELEGFEKDIHEKEGKIRQMQQENETLRAERDALTEKNENLMNQIQAANRKLLEMEEHPANLRAIEDVARKMNEMALQTRAQLDLLQEMKNEHRDTADAAAAAHTQAQSIIEAAQMQAVGITKQLQKTNMEMLSNMQAAIDHARSGYEAAFHMELGGAGQNEDKIREFPSQDSDTRIHEEQIVLNAEQARNLLKVLKRFGRPETAAQAE